MAASPARKPVHNTNTISNEETINAVRRILKIFATSDGAIRPHFFLTGPSGSSKTHTIQALAMELKLAYMDINAAQLTKEGTSGNSLSKALSPLLNSSGEPRVVFVDEYDKLFISGNTNSALAHETTTGVQNEFLRVLEGTTATVFGDYGKYVNVPVDKCLFVFAGAFNGEQNITLDRLRDFGIKTEFLGRVGLAYALQKISLDDMAKILNESTLLMDYLKLMPNASREKAIATIMEAVTANYEKNTIGVRMVFTLIHQYFINGGKLRSDEVKATTFQKTLSLDDKA